MSLDEKSDKAGPVSTEGSNNIVEPLENCDQPDKPEDTKKTQAADESNKQCSTCKRKAQDEAEVEEDGNAKIADQTEQVEQESAEMDASITVEAKGVDSSPPQPGASDPSSEATGPSEDSNPPPGFITRDEALTRLMDGLRKKPSWLRIWKSDSMVRGLIRAANEDTYEVIYEDTDEDADEHANEPKEKRKLKDPPTLHQLGDLFKHEMQMCCRKFPGLLDIIRQEAYDIERDMRKGRRRSRKTAKSSGKKTQDASSKEASKTQGSNKQDTSSAHDPSNPDNIVKETSDTSGTSGKRPAKRQKVSDEKDSSESQTQSSPLAKVKIEEAASSSSSPKSKGSNKSVGNRRSARLSQRRDTLQSISSQQSAQGASIQPKVEMHFAKGCGRYYYEGGFDPEAQDSKKEDPSAGSADQNEQENDDEP